MLEGQSATSATDMHQAWLHSTLPFITPLQLLLPAGVVPQAATVEVPVVPTSLTEQPAAAAAAAVPAAGVDPAAAAAASAAAPVVNQPDTTTGL